MADTSCVDWLHVRMLALLWGAEVSGSSGIGAQAFAILLAPCIANVVSINQVTQKQQFEPLSVIGTRALKCLQDDSQSLSTMPVRRRQIIGMIYKDSGDGGDRGASKGANGGRLIQSRPKDSKGARILFPVQVA